MFLDFNDSPQCGNFEPYPKENFEREDNLNSRIHIGGSYYLSANIPYKTVTIRMWRKGGNCQYFPTKNAITLNSGNGMN